MTDNKKQAAHEVQEELEEIAPGVFMTKADAEKQRAYNAAHPRPIENGTRSDPAPAHADKTKQHAQNAQEVTAENEQLSLFAEQTPEEQAAQRAAAVINIDTSGIDPKLDPDAPEFDIEAWREMLSAVDENGETITERTRRMIEERLTTLAKAAAEAMPKPAELSAALTGVAQSLTAAMSDAARSTMHAAFDALSGFAEFLQSETFAAIKENVQNVTSFIAEHTPEFEAFAAAAQETEALYPFLQLEIDEQNAISGEAEPITLEDVLSLMETSGEPITANIAGEPIENPYIPLIERAQQRKAEHESLYPFLVLEIEELNAASPDAEPITLEDVLELMEIGGDPITELDGEPIENPYISLIERARQRKADYEAAQEITATAEKVEKEIPRIISKMPKSIDYPLDKINSTIWNLLETAPGTGQLAFATEMRGSSKEATVLYSINFDELESEVSIIKRLEPFDKRCYIAVSALFNNGNEIITAGQIYSAMGNTGRPNGTDIEKINDSLTKMGGARVFLDNTQEISVNKRYDLFKYDAALLPFERGRAYINNQLCETAIHLFREPPLTTFARTRKQITSIPRALLTSPISKTNANLRIDDYLIERIAHIKRGKVSNKLLYKTIYERCGIIQKKQRQRAPEKIRRYLDHYKNCGFIKDYKEDNDGIIIKY